MSFKFWFMFIVVVVGQHQVSSGVIDDIKDGINAGVACVEATTKTTSTCSQAFSDRVDFKNKIEDKTGKKADTTTFECCYFAELGHCLRSGLEGPCGKEAGTIAENFIKGSVYIAYNDGCKDYTYWSPTCFFVIWLNVIIICAIVLVIASVACCVVRCLFRR